MEITPCRCVFRASSASDGRAFVAILSHSQHADADALGSSVLISANVALTIWSCNFAGGGTAHPRLSAAWPLTPPSAVTSSILIYR